VPLLFVAAFAAAFCRADVVSWLALGEARAEDFGKLLAGHELFISFVTAAEIRTFLAQRPPRARERVDDRTDLCPRVRRSPAITASARGASDERARIYERRGQRELFLSVRTVETHRAHIQTELALSTRSELVRYALEHGLMGDE
jgi:hypothetical protein